MNFTNLPKLRKGDKVAILSPSFAAPARWPHVYELGLERIRDVFGLEPVEFSATKKLGASKEERVRDLVNAFEDKEIKGVIASLGGDDQVTYIKNLPKEVFGDNPKPFFGNSDNTHFINHLWLCGVPSYYGGHVFTEFAMQNRMDEYTIKYLNYALFQSGTFEVQASPEFCDIDLDWSDETLLNVKRRYQENEGWYWDGSSNVSGITWGGCLESLDELLRHGITIPSLEEFENIVLFAETSEEVPSHEYVRRVFRALGERGVLARLRGLIIGRPKAWSFENQNTDDWKVQYKEAQRKMIVDIVRVYNREIPIIQNFDIGHTSPQICLPVGREIFIDGKTKRVEVGF